MKNLNLCASLFLLAAAAVACSKASVGSSNSTLGYGGQPGVKPTGGGDANGADKNDPKQQALVKLQSDIMDAEGRVADLKSVIGTRYPKLEKQRDRTGKLSRELLGDSNAGCHAGEKIENLVIEVTGTHSEDRKIGNTSKLLQNEGSPAKVEFRLADDMAVTNSDEEKLAYFGENPPGRVAFTGYEDHKIADIQYVKIEKFGRGFRSERHASYFLGFETGHWFENWELNRYRLDTLTITVNGNLLYRKSGINFIFEDNTRVWRDYNLVLNKEYLALMQQNNCTPKQ